MIQITEQAAQQIKRIADERGTLEGGLRVGVKGGGCSGLSYSLGYDKEARETDKIVQKDGVQLFVDPKSLLYLSGTQLD